MSRKSKEVLSKHMDAKPFIPSEKLQKSVDVQSIIAEKIKNSQKTIEYYPLPSNEGYEIFLKNVKKQQYIDTQYSLPFILSLRKNFTEIPQNMNPIRIPMKNEIRSRAKVLTDEAFRDTRNYLDVHTEVKNPKSRDFLNNFYKKISQKTKDKGKNQDVDKMVLKVSELRELLNKISYENFDSYCEQIVKINYDEELLEVFKNLIFAKATTEKNYCELYVRLCYKMFKLYNKKNYPNNPLLVYIHLNKNFKNILLKKCQEEFYNPEDTTVTFPFGMDEEEKIARLREVKLGNIRLIGDFYLQSTIPTKIVTECIDFLVNNNDDMSIRTLCELVKKISVKLYFDNLIVLDSTTDKLEELYNKDKSITSKVKFLILDIIELRRNGWGIKEEDQLKKKDKFLPDIEKSLRRGSEINNSRRSSINPTNVEYIRRSRFNSIADEMKGKQEDPNLMNELVTALGSDIEFYQCFKLSEDEFELIKKINLLYINNYENITQEEIKTSFQKTLEEIPCEKFIAVGHILEFMFSQNVNDAEISIKYLIYLHDNSLIDSDDLKHGIVLGLVNFQDNIIDYPKSKDYLQKLLVIIKAKNIIDENILKIYEKCFENISLNHK